MGHIAGMYYSNSYTNNKITSYKGKHIISCTDKFIEDITRW